MALRQYGVASIKVSFFGLDLTRGLAEGNAFQEKINSRAWTAKSNGMGNIVWMFNPDRSGEVAIQMASSSPENAKLQTLYNADLIARSIVGPLYVSDSSKGEKALFNRARIVNRPPYAFGTKLPVFTWVFGFESGIVQTFDPANNLVGA